MSPRPPLGRAALALLGAAAACDPRAAPPRDATADADDAAVVDVGDAPVIRVTAQRWRFDPPSLELRQGHPVVLELDSLDQIHGFQAPDFHARVDVIPGRPVRVPIVPDQVGTFTFHCDVYCGAGHEEMTGQIVVRPE